MNEDAKFFTAITAIVAIFFLLLFAIVYEAKGHEWYEPSCCSGQDCAPVLEEKTVQGGVLYTTSQVKDVFVPKTFKNERPSQDNHKHLCARRFEEKGPLVPICLYVPFGS